MPAEKPSSTAPITAQKTAEKPSISPPMAKRVDKTLTQIGRTRTDPYSWLKDENWQDVMKAPSILQADIREYLEAENAYTMIKLEKPTEALREDIFNEMRGRIKEDDASLANIDGPYAYFSKYREGGEYPIFARRAASDVYNEDANADILLDGDALGKDKSYFSFGGVGHSPDHTLMAYSVDEMVLNNTKSDSAMSPQVKTCQTQLMAQPAASHGVKILTRFTGLSAMTMPALWPCIATR